jgi:hypothetical protein
MTLLTIAAAIQEAAAPDARQGLTAFSWSFMLVSIGAVTALTAWCYSRILGRKEHFDPDGTGPARPPVSGSAEPPG